MINYFKNLFNKKYKTKFISIEQEMLEDMKEIDRAKPEWDMEIRVSDAIGMIKNGNMRESLMLSMYGEKVLSVAKQRVE